MTRHKAFRFRVYPSADQRATLERWEGALRFLWNLAHEQRLLGLARPRGERRYYSANEQQKGLTELRRDLPWLKEVPYDVAADLLVALEAAWDRCFAGLSRQPRWKRKGESTVVIRQSRPKWWRIAVGVLHFPKLGPMPIVQHREMEGTRGTCSLVRDVDQWFAVITCEVDAEEPVARTTPVVALDRGVALLVADSDGRTIENPRHLQRSLVRLARAQRRVSRRQKGSRNREKAKIIVAKLHRKVRRQRDHVLHGISTAYAKSHGTVVIEKLHVKGMSAAGGSHKAGLNRSILDAAWGRLATMLRYKLAWSGGTLVEVPAAYSSQTCSACGAVDPRSRRSQSEFLCVHCGHAENADVNAAKVLLLRANRPAMPVEGVLPEGARRSRNSGLQGGEPRFNNHPRGTARRGTR